MSDHTAPQETENVNTGFAWKYFMWRYCMPLALLLIYFAPPMRAQEPNGSLRLAAQPAATEISARSVGQPEATSPQAAPAGQSLTLEQLLQMARMNNPTLGEAQAGIRKAAGRTLQAGLWPNPTVGYAGDEIRGGSFRGGEQGVFIQQNVILGGKLDLDRKIFAEEGKQTEAEAEEQRLRVDSSVRIAFYKSLAAQEMVQTRTRLSGLAKDAVETTQQLFNIGQADEPDLLQAQVEADEADLAVLVAEQEQRRAWRVLSAVVGKPAMALEQLEGNLDDLPSVDPDRMLETILRDSPAVKIAELSSARAEAALARARREIVPDLFLRAGLSNDFEPLGDATSRPVGLIGFAEVGVDLRLFNRNQGNVQAARADLDRANLEVQRVSLALRQMSAPVLENYASSRAVAEMYKSRTLPNAQRAYELYLQKYRQGAAAYPQALIAERTFFDLQANYISSLENVWINALTLQGLLLTDGLDVPAAPGEIENAVREINMPTAETPGTRP
jgi:cobalt-zinc-cadmium efflux system outer membrane protein